MQVVSSYLYISLFIYTYIYQIYAIIHYYTQYLARWRIKKLIEK